MTNLNSGSSTPAAHPVASTPLQSPVFKVDTYQDGEEGLEHLDETGCFATEDEASRAALASLRALGPPKPETLGLDADDDLVFFWRATVVLGQFAVVRAGSWPPTILESLAATDPRIREGWMDDEARGIQFMPAASYGEHKDFAFIWEVGEVAPSREP